MAIKTYKRGGNTKLSENFKVSEFLCKGNACCTEGKVDTALVAILQKIRDHFGKPVHITSAYRCKTWNKKVGGVSGSYHLSGKAADIKVEDTTPAEVAKYAESIGVLGIGLYETNADGHFVHVDTRTKKSYWYGQKQQKRTTFGGALADCTIQVRVLARGDEDDHVEAMQRLLICRGFSCGSTGADGNFGPATEKAVLAFKKAAGLTENGVCDAETWTKLLGMGGVDHDE